MENSKKRLKSVDLAKGLGIICVALYHCVDITKGPQGMTIFYTLVGLFGALMGVFFFLSGYFYKPGKSYFENVRHRIKNLVIPLIVMMLVVCVVGFFAEWILVSRPSAITYAKHFVKRLFDTDSFLPYGTFGNDTASIYTFLTPSWFIVRLFFCDLIFYAVVDFCIKNFKNLIAGIAVLLSVTALYQRFAPCYFAFQLESCFAITALMVFAAYCAKHDVLRKIEYGFKSIKYWLILSAFTVAYVFCAMYLSSYYGYNLSHGEFQFASKSLESVYVWFFCQIVCSYMFLFVCAWLSKIPYLFKPIIFCGESSEIILVLHVLVQWIILKSIDRNNTLYMTIYYLETDHETKTLHQVIAFVGSIVILCLLNFLLKKCKAYFKGKKAVPSSVK